MRYLSPGAGCKAQGTLHWQRDTGHRTQGEELKGNLTGILSFVER